jgi:hypothetical protein
MKSTMPWPAACSTARTTTCDSPGLPGAARQQRNGARHPDGQAEAEDIGLPAHHDRARQFCAIRSYLSTAAKHDLSFFDALVMLAKGEPWMPAAA